ncbi:DUF6444 domain-containing protein [Streptomyces sp. NPDC007205]|uniref:DUF6444 domain-containing protein n=1 Tax=Streptomyces sp. NPDC007205 TaxID=3154316 RepID=UPI0033D07CBD
MSIHGWCRAAARPENAELKRRLGKDSTDSSRPSSSDGPEKKATRSQRERSKDRNPGGQPGRAGRCLEPSWSLTVWNGSSRPDAPTATARCPVRRRRVSGRSRSSTSR